MEVSLETLEGLERKLRIAVPETVVASEIEACVRTYAKKASLPGFRRGKVPERVIRTQFRDAVNDEVANKLVSESVRKVLEEKDLKLASQPKVVKEPVVLAGQPFEIEVSFQVMPEFDLKDLGSIAIDRNRVEITDADVSEALEKLREEHKEYKAVNRPSKDQDEIVIDFVGKLGDELLENGSAEDFNLILGSHSMIEGFEDGLLGKSAGDKFTLDLKFPEQYFKEDLAGKPVKFDITVKSVNEAVLPELDDNFALTLGLKEGSFEKLKQEIKDNLDRDAKHIIKNQVRDQLVEKLLAFYTFEVPSDLVSHEQMQLQKKAFEQLKRSLEGGRSPDFSSLPKMPEDMFAGQANKRVKTGILFSRYVEHFDLKPDADKVRTMIEEMAKGYQQPEQIINWYYSDEQRLAQIESIVLEDLVVDKLLAGCQVKDLTKAYKELVQENEAQEAIEDAHDHADHAHHHDHDHDHHHHHDGDCCDHDHSHDK